MYFVVIPAKVKSVVKDIPGEVFTQKLVSNHTEAKVKVPNRTNSRKTVDVVAFKANETSVFPGLRIRLDGVIMTRTPALSRPIAPPYFAYEKLALHFKPFQVQDQTHVGKHPERLTDAAGPSCCFIAFLPTQSLSPVRHGLQICFCKKEVTHTLLGFNAVATCIYRERKKVHCFLWTQVS